MARVCSTTSGGSSGAGGFLSQPWAVAQSRTYCLSKEGILDPQGKAVERALPALGFEGIGQVHVGRMVELEADDLERLGELCEKLLANPLIEDYEIQPL